MVVGVYTYPQPESKANQRRVRTELARRTASEIRALRPDPSPKPARQSGSKHLTVIIVTLDRQHKRSAHRGGRVCRKVSSKIGNSLSTI